MQTCVSKTQISLEWASWNPICLERGADLHMAQLMPLLLTVSCFSKIQIRFTFLVLARPGGPGQRAVKRVCVCVWCVCCRASPQVWDERWRAHVDMATLNSSLQQCRRANTDLVVDVQLTRLNDRTTALDAATGRLSAALDRFRSVL